MFQQTGQRSVPGVLFIEDFDDVLITTQSAAVAQAHDLEPEPEEVEPRLTRQEAENLYANARDEGFTAGYAAAERSAQAEHLAIARKLENALLRLGTEMTEIVHRDVELVADAALSLLVECLPALCERHGADETRRALHSVLSSVIDEPELTVMVSPDLVDVVKRDVSLSAAGKCRVIVTACPKMVPGDIRVTWEHGSASRDVRRLRGLLVERLFGLGLLHLNDKDVVV